MLFWSMHAKNKNWLSLSYSHPHSDEKAVLGKSNKNASLQQPLSPCLHGFFDVFTKDTGEYP